MAKKIPLDRLRRISKHRSLRALPITDSYAQPGEGEAPESDLNESPAAVAPWI